jgi:hypothetical protein
MEKLMSQPRWLRAALFVCASVSMMMCNVEEEDTQVLGREETIASQLFTGKVVDGNNKPISGARVTINGILRITGATGQYAVSVADSQSGYHIDIRKNGYGPLTERRTAGAQSAVHKLQTGFTQTIDPTRETVVTDQSSGIRVTIPASSLRSATGAPSGAVRFTIVPHSSQTMPGDFTAVRPDGTRVGLVSVGAVTLQAEDAAGNTLIVAPGAALNVVLPVPASAGGSMPACVLEGTCRLAIWSFDRQTRLWVERPESQLVATPTTTTFPVATRSIDVDPSNGIGTWNADVDTGPNTSCVVIEFSNIPLSCYNPMMLTPEPGISLTFNQIGTLGNITKTETVTSAAIFIVLYNLQAATNLTLSFAFPPGASPLCAASLLLSAVPAPVSVGAGTMVVNSGPPWGAGVPPMPFTQCGSQVIATM